jgi:hypothetical protein
MRFAALRNYNCKLYTIASSIQDYWIPILFCRNEAKNCSNFKGRSQRLQPSFLQRPTSIISATTGADYGCRSFRRLEGLVTTAEESYRAIQFTKAVQFRGHVASFDERQIVRLTFD